LSEQTKDLRDLSVLVTSIVIAGHVDDYFSASFSEMRSWNDRNGFHNVEYRHQPAVLVEKGRDDAVEHALKQGYDAIMQIDADMCEFPSNAMALMLHRLWIEYPWADAIGGYCNLKGPPYLPTIDTGTGRWENWYPGSGVLPVIRTGGAFLMVKTTAFRKFGPPWFRTRIANSPLAALADVDNFARCKLDGENPFYNTPDWLSLKMEAGKAGGGESSIGEDSGFCDRLKAAGGQILVDTDIVVGHVAKQVITWRDHKKMIDDHKKQERLVVGVTK